MKKVIVPVVLIILTGMLTANSIYQTQAAKVKQAEAAITEEKKKHSALKKIKEIEDKIKKYNPCLSDSADVNQFLEVINKTISGTDINLVSIKPLSFEEQAGYGFLRVVLKAICTYHQLGDFISKLENSKMFIKIDNIKFKLIDKPGSRAGKMSVSEYGEPAAGEVVLRTSAIYKK